MSKVQGACMHCRWFFRERGRLIGDCRAKPPVVIDSGETCFPGVKVEHWCGSFEPKEREPAPPESKPQKDLAEHEKTVTIPAREHNELSYAATLLQALKDFGVDNWEGYEDAVEAAEENHDGEIPHE